MLDVPEVLITGAVGVGVAILGFLQKVINQKKFGTAGITTSEYGLALLVIVIVILGLWLIHLQGPTDISTGAGLTFLGMFGAIAWTSGKYSEARSQFKQKIVENGKAPDNGRLTK